MKTKDIVLILAMFLIMIVLIAPTIWFINNAPTRRFIATSASEVTPFDQPSLVEKKMVEVVFGMKERNHLTVILRMKPEFFKENRGVIMHEEIVISPEIYSFFQRPRDYFSDPPRDFVLLKGKDGIWKLDFKLE